MSLKKKMSQSTSKLKLCLYCCNLPVKLDQWRSWKLFLYKFKTRHGLRDNYSYDITKRWLIWLSAESFTPLLNKSKRRRGDRKMPYIDYINLFKKKYFITGLNPFIQTHKSPNKHERQYIQNTDNDSSHPLSSGQRGVLLTVWTDDNRATASI